MYAMITKEPLAGEVDCNPAEVDDLYSWRKHPNLHTWMAGLYYVKGGTDRMFNGATVALNTQDLNLLEAFIKGNALPETVGFCFGTSDETMIDGDLEFVALARNALSEGYSVLYTSSW
ncbi:phosphoglycerate kinase [Donghicola mangrovi]|nr:phosphoglycerate kinase [Donghicola mangrovi]